MKNMRLWLFAAFFVFLFASPGSTYADAMMWPVRNGLSVMEFHNFSRSISKLPGRIQAIRLLNGKSGRTEAIALLTFGARSGWQIFVYELPSNNKDFQLQWKSGRLDDTFSVSEPSDFKTVTLGNGEQAVAYAGCAPRSCPDSVFSVLLYVPSKQTAFTAKYILGKIAYSSALGLTENHQFKNILDQMIYERRERK